MFTITIEAGLPKRYGQALVLGMVILAGGCTVGPNYQRPELSLRPFKGQATQASDLPATSTEAAAQTWWNAFNDPQLSRIIEHVIAENLDLASAAARVTQARAAAEEAGASLLPSGSLDASVAPQHQSELTPIGGLASSRPGYNRNKSLYNLSVGATWEIDAAGGLMRESQAAENNARAVEADQFAMRVSVTAEAADAYFQAKGYKARLILAQAQIEADEHLLTLVKQRVEQGASFDRELSQARALVYQAKSSLAPLRIGLTMQLNRLDILMGVQPGSGAIELADTVNPLNIPSDWQALTPQRMLRRRPDIAAAERRLAASSEEIGAALSNYYPKFSLSSLLGFSSLGQGLRPQQLFSAAAFQTQALIGLQWRIFDFGKIDAQVKLAKGKNQEALAQYRQAVLRATEDVENALTVYAQLQDEEHQVNEEVEALQRSRNESQEAYTSGAIALTDVLDADRLLLSARDQLATVHYDHARSAVKLYRSMGGGWTPDSSQ